MARRGDPPRQLWTRLIAALGHNYVFWPVVLGGLVFGSGPGRWPSPWIWALVLLAAGPLLSFALWKWEHRTVDRMAGPQLWRIELLIETDDRERVEQIATDVGRLACDREDIDHLCDPPWMVMTSPVDPSDENDVRDMLNR